MPAKLTKALSGVFRHTLMVLLLQVSVTARSNANYSPFTTSVYSQDELDKVAERGHRDLYLTVYFSDTTSSYDFRSMYAQNKTYLRRIIFKNFDGTKHNITSLGMLMTRDESCVHHEKLYRTPVLRFEVEGSRQSQMILILPEDIVAIGNLQVAGYDSIVAPRALEYCLAIEFHRPIRMDQNTYENLNYRSVVAEISIPDSTNWMRWMMQDGAAPPDYRVDEDAWFKYWQGEAGIKRSTYYKITSKGDSGSIQLRDSLLASVLPPLDGSAHAYSATLIIRKHEFRYQASYTLRRGEFDKPRIRLMGHYEHSVAVDWLSGGGPKSIHMRERDFVRWSWLRTVGKKGTSIHIQYNNGHYHRESRIKKYRMGLRINLCRIVTGVDVHYRR